MQAEPHTQRQETSEVTEGAGREQCGQGGVICSRVLWDSHVWRKLPSAFGDIWAKENGRRLHRCRSLFREVYKEGLEL